MIKHLKSITITTGIYPPDIGGPASFIPIFANMLTKKGIDVTVITLTDKKQDDFSLPYKVIRISRTIKKPFRDLLVIRAIIRYAKESDLIFSNTLAFESFVSSKITRKKLVQKIVGDLAWERANGSGRFKGNLEEYQIEPLDIKSKLTNIYRNLSVNGSDIIITPSYYLKNIVSKWGYPEEKIKVIFNAVEFETADKTIIKSKYRIISVARLIPLKGIETILKTLAQLEFDFEYILIGGGPLKNSLLRLSNSLSVDMQLIENIPKKDVANWLSSSDIFIQNSSHETMPHIVLEAMENSCPVIASYVGGTPEIVKDKENGLLFKHNNIAELLEKINLIKNNDVLRNKLIKKGKEFTTESANIDSMSNKYIEELERIL